MAMDLAGLCGRAGQETSSRAELIDYSSRVGHAADRHRAGIGRTQDALLGVAGRRRSDDAQGAGPLYRRKGLPVKVVKAYKAEHAEWRRIQDPDGAEGWVQANLLSDKRSALVIGDVRPLREKPAAGSPIVWRAEPGVVGRVRQCANGWCHLDVQGRAGFIQTTQLFGVAADEQLP
jgi:SH3-like domain-containing protein